MFNTAYVSKHLSRSFALLILGLIGFGAAYSWHSWQSTKTAALRHATELVDMGEKSLNAYFSQIEVALGLSSQDMLDARGRMDPIVAQSRLISLTKANPDLVSANILSLDGLIILSSNPNAKLPAPTPNRASLNQTIDELSKGQSLSIGHPFIGPFAKEWLIPYRYAVRDAAGNLRYVLAATLPLSKPQSFWKDTSLPPGVALGLIRDDGHLVSRYPVPKSLDLTDIYEKPRTGALIKHLQQKQFPVSGYLDGPNSLEDSSRLMVFRRLSKYPLTFFVTQPMSNIRADWWSNVQVPYLLLLLLLAGGFAAFRWMLRTQRAWEAERNDTERTLRELNQNLNRLVAERTGELQESERFVRASLDALSSHVAVLDGNGRTLATNRAWREFAEQNQLPWKQVSAGADYLGVCDRAATAGDADAATVARLIREVIAGKRTDASFEYPCHSPQEQRWFLCRLTRFPGDDSARVAVAHENITVRKRAEAEIQQLNAELEQRVAARTVELAQTADGLRDSTARIHAILNTVVDGIITIDERGTVESLNPAAERIFGYAAAEVVKQNIKMLMPEPYHSQHDGYLEHYRATGEARIIGIGREVVGRRKDGSTFPLELAVSRMQLGDERHFTGIVRDITARKQGEQALLSARDAAEQANRTKDSFLATMSHEIRTPLGGLMGMLELLSFSPLNREQGETLHAARDSGRSLLRILNDILDWSKIEEGKLELAPQATSMAQLVAEVANTYAHVASSSSVTLAQQADARLSPALMVDPLRLSQVLNNFVSNAIKFSHRGGRVELRAELIARRDGAEEVRFSVKDTGIGIDPEVQQRLFHQYSQGSADTARMYGGTGLGLAICSRLADLMGGRIDLDSAPGRGSTFSLTLTLPVAKTVLEATRSPAEIVAAASVRPLDFGVAQADAPLVLVVDDHPINRKLLVLQLGLLDLRAETAENGEAALALWRAGRYALVITDCHMPVMDGYALTRAIRAIEAAEARAHTPVFAWTANALADETDNCRAAGMDELLVKPAELVQLKTMLAKWLPSAAEPVPDRNVPPVPQAAAPLAVDVSVLKALVGDDAAIIREFLRDFRASAAAIAAEIRAACQGGQATAASAAAHKLKSSARAVGAFALGELCEQMEQAGKAGDSEALAASLPRFEAEMAVVEDYLDKGRF